MPDNVRLARNGIEYIKSKTDTVLNGEQVAIVIEQIESGRLARSFKTNRQHIKNVRETVKNKLNIKECNKCCSSMVLRKATKSKNSDNEFWGCNNFPKCRNIVLIS